MSFEVTAGLSACGWSSVNLKISTPAPMFSDGDTCARIRFDTMLLFERKYSPPISPCHQVPQSRSEEHTSELQSQSNLVCRLLLEKKKKKKKKKKTKQRNHQH